MKGSKYAGTIGYINDALDDLLVESMGYIDDDLLVESIEYQSVPLLHRVVRNAVLKICACFVIVAALIFGLVFINSNEDNGIASLFVLTAYAAEDEEDVVSSNALGMGKAVPISVFETTKGVKGFVFSCNKEDEDASTSIVIISNGNYYDHIEEIVGITIDPTQNYYFYIQIPQFENSTQEATAVMTVALSGEVDFFSTTAGTVIATKNIDYATAGIEAYITKNTNGNTVWGRVVRSICYTDISQPISFMALNPTVTYANAGEVINWIGEGSYIAYINGTHYYLYSGTQNAMFYVNIYK